MRKRVLLSWAAILATISLLASPHAMAQNNESDTSAGLSVQIAGPTRIPIKEFLWIVSQQQGIRFIMDDGLNGGEKIGAVDVIVPYGRPDDEGKNSGFEIPRGALFNVLQAMLKQKKHILVPFGEDTATSIQFYEILSINEAMTSSRAEDVVILDDIRSFTGDGSGFVTLVAPIKNIDANGVRTALAPLITRGGQVVPIGRNMLLIADYAANVRRLGKVIDLMDRKPEVPQAVEFNIEHIDAQELAEVLREVIDGRRALLQAGVAGRGTGNNLLEEELVEITLPPNVNSLLVQGHEPGIQLVKELIAKLDRKIKGIDGVNLKFHTYKARNAEALELATTLDGLLSQGIPLGSGSVPITPPGVTPAPPIPGGQGAFADYQPSIEVDENTNMLIITAKPRDFNDLRKILEVLDVRRPQVMIEAAILEVRQDEDFTFGVELATIDNSGDGFRAAAGTSWGFSEIVDADGVPVGTGGGVPEGRTPLFGTGGLFTLTKGGAFNIPLLISFLKTQTNINILSVPRVLANDNEESLIEILTEVPVEQTTATGNSGIIGGGFDFVQDGITLRVTPHISEGGYVVLDMVFEVEAFIGAPAQPGAPPPRTTRNVDTFVTVPDGQTVVIGGLTSNTSSKSVNKIPFLGDIPILGELFKSESTESRQTNLYIFVRPKIYRHKEFDDLINDSVTELQNAKKQLLPNKSTENYFKKALRDNEEERLSGDPTSSPRRLALPDLPIGE